MKTLFKQMLSLALSNRRNRRILTALGVGLVFLTVLMIGTAFWAGSKAIQFVASSPQVERFQGEVRSLAIAPDSQLNEVLQETQSNWQERLQPCLSASQKLLNTDYILTSSLSHLFHEIRVACFGPKDKTPQQKLETQRRIEA